VSSPLLRLRGSFQYFVRNCVGEDIFLRLFEIVGFVVHGNSCTNGNDAARLVVPKAVGTFLGATPWARRMGDQLTTYSPRHDAALPHLLQRRRFIKAAIGASSLRPNRANSARDREPSCRQRRQRTATGRKR
jgi:hypothetical protein